MELVGATIFPRLNLTIKPEKGTALLWHNLESCGSSHPKALHAACPVISSSKYGKSREFSIISKMRLTLFAVLTKQIYNLDQMFINPCQAHCTNS